MPSRPRSAGERGESRHRRAAPRRPSRRSPHLLANQPNVSKEGASGIVPSSEIAPCVVRRPISPQKLAGARTEPPVSEPVPMSASPPATAAADPDDEPPVTRSGARGFTGCGKCTFWPIIEKASSSVCVLPMKRAPASSSFCTAGAVRRGDLALGELVRIAPAGHVARDVEDVLHAQRQPGERPGSRRSRPELPAVEEGVQSVARLELAASFNIRRQ